MKKVYKELCLKILQVDLDVITSSGDVDVGDFNEAWLD